jgi:hypothetical protein
LQVVDLVEMLKDILMDVLELVEQVACLQVSGQELLVEELLQLP